MIKQINKNKMKKRFLKKKKKNNNNNNKNHLNSLQWKAFLPTQ